MAFRRSSFDTACRIEVEHSDAHLHAHVELADGIAMHPGDKVRVHGEPISVGFGERRVFNAEANEQGHADYVWAHALEHMAGTSPGVAASVILI